MDNSPCKIDYQILFLSLAFAIIISFLMKHPKKEQVENFDFTGMNLPKQNPPKKKPFVRLYFPGMIPGMSSRRTYPPVRYSESHQNLDMDLVKVIQDNAR